MRTGWIAAGIVAALALGTIATIAATTREQSLGPNAVVVELFTSQG
jgi:hypothetical protein